MTKFLLKIYDYFTAHRVARYATLAILTVVILLLASSLRYKEDISDFLPVGGKHATALKMYQNMSGANKIFITFQAEDSQETDMLVEAADSYVECLRQDYTFADSLNIMSEVDMNLADSLLDFVYGNIPYLLRTEDYDRIDSLLSSPDYVKLQLEEDLRLLMFPSGGLLSANIGRDPLNLFTPVAERLSNNASNVTYENYENHIFTPDMQTAIVMMDTPYGASESERNKQLLEVLDSVSSKVEAEYAGLKIDCIGSPVIAVGNADRIKTDCMISVSIAVILILLLLFYVFRSARNIILIAVSILWGWLFAVASLSLFHDKVSIIVIGISSIILGIAVNYPLHIIAHITHGNNKRSKFREIVTPLLVGNVTTIGAFLALVPLQSIALRDLGLFASLLLLGTIIFSLVFLPHIVKSGVEMHHTFINRLGDIKLETRPWFMVVIVILTIVFGYFSLDTKFDSNMGHINYMSDEDRTNMEHFQQMISVDTTKTQVFALVSDSSLSVALGKNEEVLALLDGENISSVNSCGNLICSDQELKKRTERWQQLKDKYEQTLHEALAREGRQLGFADDSFAEFFDILSSPLEEKTSEDFMSMASRLYEGSMMYDETTGEYSVVTQINVDNSQLSAVEEDIASIPDAFSFTMSSINSSIANNMSDNFNYIGWACGLIVFIFLWLSMGNLELAIISFTPMAVSWLWILGIMSILDVQFNIVNIILATFIFGQGDDYTIFITEGTCYEYAYRKKILNSYKHSIIVSALIMFIGIGTLVIARHPALHSLAEVTIIGMFAVVLMAYIVPPLMFRWLVATKKGYRRYPLTISRMVVTLFSAVVVVVSMVLHRLVPKLLKFVLTHIPGVKLTFHTEGMHTPSLIVSNHQSLLDRILLKAISPKAMIASSLEDAFLLSEKLNLDIIPVIIHGSNEVFPRNSLVLNKGFISVHAFPACGNASTEREIQEFFEREYESIRKSEETLAYFKPLVLARYLYKGKEIYGTVKKNLISGFYNCEISHNQDSTDIIDKGYGELALAYALMHPDTHVFANVGDTEKATILKVAAEGIVDNLTIRGNE